MAQNYQDIPATTTLSASRALLLDRDAAAASNFSGTAFPTTNLLIGMRCHRTDLNKVYVLKDLTPTWIEVEDVAGISGLAPRATVLATSRNFSVTGDVATASPVAFNGSGDVALSVSLATQAGLTAGTYSKVTVNTKGIVTAGSALANADLPTAISQNTLRATSTTAVSLASTGHGFQVGADGSTNIAMSTGAIQARNNGAAATLSLNSLGGNVTVGAASATVTIPGTLSAGTWNLPAGTVVASTITDGAVITSKIQDAAVTSAKIAANAVTSGKLNFATGTFSFSHGSGGGGGNISIAATTINWGFDYSGSKPVAVQVGTSGSPIVNYSVSSTSAGNFYWRYLA